jgi:hypothetical protein
MALPSDDFFLPDFENSCQQFLFPAFAPRRTESGFSAIGPRRPPCFCDGANLADWRLPEFRLDGTCIRSEKRWF